MCTKEETTNTGINIETVRESKLNPHKILNDSESTHLKVNTDTDTLFKATSVKIVMAIIVVVIIHELVISCAPVTPTFLPKNPEAIDPSKGNIIMAKYIYHTL